MIYLIGHVEDPDQSMVLGRLMARLITYRTNNRNNFYKVSVNAPIYLIV